jgi:hypothetical protein
MADCCERGNEPSSLMKLGGGGWNFWAEELFAFHLALRS